MSRKKTKARKTKARKPRKPTPKRQRKPAARKRCGKRNPGRKAQLPPGFKLEPARHGLHGYTLRRDGRLSGTIYSSKGEAFRAAWKWHRGSHGAGESGIRSAHRDLKTRLRATEARLKVLRRDRARRGERGFTGEMAALQTQATKLRDALRVLGSQLRKNPSPVLTILMPNPAKATARTVAAAALKQTKRDLRAAIAFLEVYLRKGRLSGTAWKLFRSAREVLEAKLRTKRKAKARAAAAARAKASKKKPRRNPRAVPRALQAFLSRQPVGRKFKWAELPEDVRANKFVQRAARKEARLTGVSRDELIFEVVKDPLGATPVAFESGDLKAIEYVPPKRSKRAGNTYRHEAGDHGRGRRRTRPATLAVDARTGAEILLDRRGVRRSFSTDVGHKG